ncbi:YybH family protein [Peribacillus sp. B-H-3]|jgi:ketosteroid isomerase-like protein|uniref:YybH family protein n=1 Tax=Peribacillus sp. B-H-3 TaxID=3400420 RepID=UPI003B013797
MNHIQALENYIAATNTHVFSNVENLLAEGAIYWFTDKTCTTRDEIKKYFEHAWNTIQNEVYGAKNVRWIAEDRHVAICIYTYTWKGIYDNAPSAGSGRATNVFVRSCDGSWKVKHEHLSGLSTLYNI